MTINNDQLFQDFVHDLQNLHRVCREFHRTWDGITEDMVITEEQRGILKSIWDQHEAWYEDKIDVANTQKELGL